uniref:Uncharacterized protein n=1 Tax=viral metagenome TaxID=1070528 RepID=A0A6M3K211_9ZZZZ
MEQIVKWMVDSEADRPYKTATWYRCMGIQKFVEEVEGQIGTIVAIVFSDNNIGFVIDDGPSQT